jgi:hypothetical protein
MSQLALTFHVQEMVKKTVPRCTAKMKFVRPAHLVIALREKFAILTKHPFQTLKISVSMVVSHLTFLSAQTHSIAMQPKNVLNHVMPRIQAPALTDITATLRLLNVSLSRNFHAVVMEKRTVLRCTAKMAFAIPVLQVIVSKEKFVTLTLLVFQTLKNSVFTDA